MQPFYVISSRRMSALQAALQEAGFAFKRVVGKWQGEREVSLVIPAGPDDLSAIQALAFTHDQEAFLYVDQRRQAFLHPGHPSRYPRNGEYLGRWVALPNRYAPNSAEPPRGDYTYDPERNTYHVVKP